MTVTIANIGHSATAELTGTLTTSDPNVTIMTPGGTAGPIPFGDEGTMGTFEIEILAACPSPTQIPLQVEVSADNGFHAILDYEMAVGPWFDDAEAERGWTLGAPGDNATSGIWIREDPVGTTYNSQAGAAGGRPHSSAGRGLLRHRQRGAGRGGRRRPTSTAARRRSYRRSSISPTRRRRA